MRTATASTHARAALAGNPSDGYGGMTLAVCLREFAATATATAGEPTAHLPLVDAAIARFAKLTGERPSVRVEIETTIPREVGLAGSSAIVIATLRALAALVGTPIDDATLAATALATETEELGIAAGPQDRVVQTHGGLLAMDFATSTHEPLDCRLLPPLFVAWRTDGGAASGTVHGDLRARYAAGEEQVHDGMRILAAHARAARDALLAADHAAFAAALDGSFDARASMIRLDPVDASLVHLARAHGAAANYAGSGGAIVGTTTHGTEALAAAFRVAGHGFTAVAAPTEAAR